MDYYEFYNPIKILSGENALENIPYELNVRGALRPLIITSGTPIKVGLTSIITDALVGYGIEANAIFSDVEKDSSFETVEKAAQFYQRNACDSIIALGGGSVLDTAKGVKILISQGADSLERFMGNEMIPAGLPVPFIMIPTTAGTGSECTKVAVIANPKEQIKHEFISTELLPNVAVIDPRTTLTLPPRATAATGADAMVHCVEAFTCLQKNPISDAFALGALDLIGRNFINAVNDGEDAVYRLAMSNAALMAGIAFSNSMVGLCHAIGHACGAIGHVAHGEAMAILLPAVMRYNMDAMLNGALLSDLYGRLLLPLSGDEVYAQTQSRKRMEKTIERIEEILAYLHQKCGLPLTLEQADITEKDFAAIAELAQNDGAILVNPKPAGFDQIIEILQACK